MLRDQASRLARLSQDLAAVTRAESGDLQLQLQATDPRDLVQACVHAARERAALGGVELIGDVGEPALPSVLVDRDRMAQVLDNLVGNAVRHTPPGGTVAVAVARTSEEQVALRVSDTGEGIGVEHLPHVFERFYRADTARDRGHGGSGIGLAICKALTHAHGGTIEVISAGAGHGATFTVTLPSAGHPPFRRVSRPVPNEAAT